MTTAQEIHQRALVIDGLSYYSDGYTSGLKTGGIDALNVTVCHFEADYREACDRIAGWLTRTAAPDSEWRLVERREDLDLARAAGKIGIVMGWQNMRPVEDDLDRLALFRKLGVRIMQITYNYRNFLGDGCLETEDGGLSVLGRDAVRLMNRLGIAIDLSHVGDRTSLDAIALSDTPVLATHADARALVDLPRNKPDHILKAIAETGGVIGASVYGPMLWDGDRTRRPTIDDFVRHLEHIVEIAGIDHVGFGTDLPASKDLTKTAFEAANRRLWSGISSYGDSFGHDIPARYPADANAHAKLPAITEALVNRGWRAQDIEAYLGGNFARVFSEIWGE
jgi:membrane dipeptidase